MKHWTRWITIWVMLVSLAGLQMPADAAPLQAAKTFTVDSAEDDADAVVGNGTCLTSAGKCTLRAAIQEANATTDKDTILFNIPSAAAIPRLIFPAAPLPMISNQVIIDGPNASGHAIILDGTGVALSAGQSNIGLDVGFSFVEIYGLVIRNFEIGISLAQLTGDHTIGAAGVDRMVVYNSDYGIRIHSAFTLLQNTWVGIDSSGMPGSDQMVNGIQVFGESNTIGAAGAGGSLRNVVGNATQGILVTGKFNTVQDSFIGLAPDGETGLHVVYGIHVGGDGTIIKNNVIASGSFAGVYINLSSRETELRNNIIGMNAAGTAAVPNEDGIYLDEANGTIIGSPGAGNLISGNAHDGIYIASADVGRVYNTRIEDNWIGLASDHITPIGNMHGIRIGCSADSIVKQNKVAYNTKEGIVVFASGTCWPAKLTQNLIWGNGEIPIDLDEDGITPNDNLDADNGPNGLQNYPLISTVTVNHNTNQAAFTASLHAKPSTAYTIEAFAAPFCGAAGQGEAVFYLGSTSVTTNASGNATINLVLANPNGVNCYSLTATDPAGNTSEISPGLFKGSFTYLPAIRK